MQAPAAQSLPPQAFLNSELVAQIDGQGQVKNIPSFVTYCSNKEDSNGNCALSLLVLWAQSAQNLFLRTRIIHYIQQSLNGVDINDQDIFSKFFVLNKFDESFIHIAARYGLHEIVIPAFELFKKFADEESVRKYLEEFLVIAQEQDENHVIQSNKNILVAALLKLKQSLPVVEKKRQSKTRNGRSYLQAAGGFHQEAAIVNEEEASLEVLPERPQSKRAKRGERNHRRESNRDMRDMVVVLPPQYPEAVRQLPPLYSEPVLPSYEGALSNVLYRIVECLKVGNTDYDSILANLPLAFWIRGDSDSSLLMQLIKICFVVVDKSERHRIELFILYILKQLKEHLNLIQPDSPLWVQDFYGEDIIVMSLKRWMNTIGMELLSLRKSVDPAGFKVYLETPQRGTALIVNAFRSDFSEQDRKSFKEAVSIAAASSDRKELKQNLKKLYCDEGACIPAWIRYDAYVCSDNSLVYLTDDGSMALGRLNSQEKWVSTGYELCDGDTERPYYLDWAKRIVPLVKK